jgi:hypothetical protein
MGVHLGLLAALNPLKGVVPPTARTRVHEQRA